MKYQVTPGPMDKAIRLAREWWHRVLYFCGIALWLIMLMKPLFDQSFADTTIIKVMVGPVLGMMWLLHERLMSTDLTVKRIETKLDPVLGKFDTVQSMEEAAKAIQGIIADLGAHETAHVDFFGHNLSRAWDYLDSVVLAPGTVRNINLRVLVLDPTVDPTRKPITYFSAAPQVVDSLHFLQSKLRQRQSQAHKLSRKISITVKAYQSYPYIGGFRVSIPSREKAYYFVSFVGIRQDTQEPGWYDKYISATVRGHDQGLEEDSCPSLNFYAAELYTGLFTYVFEKESVDFCSLNYPEKLDFSFMPQFAQLMDIRKLARSKVNP